MLPRMRCTARTLAPPRTFSARPLVSRSAERPSAAIRPQQSRLPAVTMCLSTLSLAPPHRFSLSLPRRHYATEEKEEENQEEATEAPSQPIDPSAAAAQRAARKEHQKTKAQLLKEQRKKMLERSKVQREKQDARKAKMAEHKQLQQKLPKKFRLDDFEDIDDDDDVPAGKQRK